MAGPAALFFSENIVEGIGLVVGLTDVGLNASETPRGEHGIPLDRPYIEVDRFSLSQSRIVVGDKIHVSGVLKIGLGQLVDHTFNHGEGNLWYKIHYPSYSLTVKSDGGIEARVWTLIHTYEKTPEPSTYSWKTYEVEGEGEGGYVIDRLNGVNERPRRLRIRKICSEDSPILSVPFQFILEGRQVGNEDIWVEAEVKGYEAEIGEDAERVVTDNSEPLTVEISRPYQVVTSVDSGHVQHGSRVDCKLELTNRAFEKELSWETSTLDGDYRGASSLAPRKTANNKRTINRWEEGHTGMHPCRDGETWLSPAFTVTPWQIENLHIDLDKDPDWTETWNGNPVPVKCVRTCSPFDRFINWYLRIGRIGRFIRRGTRTYWKPEKEPPEESGRDANDPPLPPLPGYRFTGIRGVISPRYNVRSNEIKAILTSNDSGETVAVTIGENGDFTLEQWPYSEQDSALLIFSAPGFRDRRVHNVQKGAVINATLFPDTVRLVGFIQNGFEESAYHNLRVYLRKEDDPEDIYTLAVPYTAWVKGNGTFELGGLPRGEPFVVEAEAESSDGITLKAMQEIVLKEDINEVELKLESPTYTNIPPVAALSGIINTQSDYSVSVEVFGKNKVNEILAQTKVSEDGRWSLPDLPTRQALRLRIFTSHSQTFFSPIFQLTDDMELPEVYIE